MEGEPQEKLFVSPEMLRNYENFVQGFLDSAGRLTVVFRDRDEDRFSELMDDSDVNHMQSAFNRLGELQIKDPKDFEEVSQIFVALSQSLDTIGTVRSHSFKDSEESLKRVSFALMMMGETAHELARQLQSIGTNEALGAAQQVGNFIDTAMQSRTVVLKRIDQIGRYSEQY